MRFLFCSLLFLSFYPLIAQNTTPLAPHTPAFNDYYLCEDHRPTIHGKVINLPSSVDRKGLFGYSAVGLTRDEQDEVSVDLAQDGTFTVVLPHSVPAQEVWFWLGDHFYGCLIVRDEVTITFDYAKLTKTEQNRWLHPGVTFSGPDAALGTLRGKQIRAHKARGINFHAAIMDREKSTTEKQVQLDSIYREAKQADAEFLAGEDPSVVSYLEDDTTTDYLAISNVLYWQTQMPKQLRDRYLQHQPLTISNSTHDFYSYFASMIKSSAGRTMQEKLDISLLEANLHPQTVDYLLGYLDGSFPAARADIYKLYLEFKDPAYNLEVLEKTISTVKTPWVEQILKKRLRQQKKATDAMLAELAKKTKVINPKDLGEPTASFDFSAELYATPTGQSGEDLLKKIRGAFPDQAIYLDFWAVWCGPCIQEMPFSAKLHGAVHDLPVAFVNLCTASGGDLEKWENIIAQHQVPGTHLFVPKDTHAEIMKIFSKT